MKSHAVGLALVASVAAAQSKPTLIDYPLDVRSTVTNAQLTTLQDDFRQMLARGPAVLLSTRSNWKVAVGALKRQDCDVRNECLQQLATTAGTLYAIYASVERNAASTEVTACRCGGPEGRWTRRTWSRSTTGTSNFTVNNAGNLAASFNLTLSGSSQWSINPTAGTSPAAGNSTPLDASYIHPLLGGMNNANVSLSTTTQQCAPLPANLTPTGT